MYGYSWTEYNSNSKPESKYLKITGKIQDEAKFTDHDIGAEKYLGDIPDCHTLSYTE